jgi:hypothetical protein
MRMAVIMVAMCPVPTPVIVPLMLMSGHIPPK